MKIVTLNPPFLPRYSRGQRSPAVTRSGTLYYPIWLAYATGALESEGHEVCLIDAPALNFDRAETISRIDSFQPQLVVVETSTPSIENDVAIADELAKKGYVVFLTGTHPSALPEQTIAMGSHFQGVVIGEYETTLIDIAKSIQNDQKTAGILGTAVRTTGGIIRADARLPIENLDGLPFVSNVYARHCPIEIYDNPNALHPQVMIVGSRGCPHRCSFCVFPQTLHGHRLRMRTISNIIAELRWITENLSNVRAVFFEDDTISADIGRLRLLAETIINTGIRICWTANMRPTVDYETLRLCHEAGLRTICVGFESGDNSQLAGIHKDCTTATMIQFMKNTRKIGLHVHGCFVFGLPNETRKTMERTLRFAIDLSPDTAQFYPMMVYPGTQAYQSAVENKMLAVDSFRDWITAEGLHNSVVNTVEIPAKEILRFCDYARRSFYLRPCYLFKKVVACLRDFDEFLRIIRTFAAYRKYFFWISDSCVSESKSIKRTKESGPSV
jgi:radical SAM superfamily enzyme YgiQ (UPF0313 family)